ncbi:hypothetical protein SMKI_04G4880 [Saccharomyces mikatae IFO 1815]|uniref:Glutaredoxin-like protein n=1 Tax=Saccharomyces mikatae IFO 1815 TaxID=226126 RepID=A0AA35NGP6_SACMI|nr:uncharacterized protein SMKI_04G4880 [Saccharomyces mikatae IFO 1815]CAI4038148.1 hypothetical protein SMKI_04G4880 [Saccharomyces mikatae IFO 1815]
MSRTILRTIHTSRVLLHDAEVKLTFFSKPNCGLCDQAKEVIDDVFERKEFHDKRILFKVVNINERKNAKWWKEYCFDIPVLHIEKVGDPKSCTKVLHFLEEDDISEKIRRIQSR